MRILILAVFLLLQNIAFAQLNFAKIFTDHAVLQRKQPIPIWGWAKPGEKVTVKLSDKTITTKTNTAGKWEVTFPSMEAGGPYQLSVSNKEANITFQDILIGEVWLVSGQSNMEWTVSRAQNFEEEKANANFPQIRHYKVPNKVALEPENDLAKGEWKVSSSETVPNFSAIGFFFARELAHELNVPVGIINSSWGGSQIEGWISKNAMANDAEFKSYAGTIPTTWQDLTSKVDQKLFQNIAGKDTPFPTAQQESAYHNTPFKDLKALKSDSPTGGWDWKGLSWFRGKAFMTTEFEAKNALNDAKLALGSNGFNNIIRVNNQVIYSGTLDKDKKISIPSGLIKNGTNTLSILIGENTKSEVQEAPGIHGSSKDLMVFNENDTISLQKNWKVIPIFSEKHTYGLWMNSEVSVIYNSMIAPVIPYGIKGFLWYQGESNASRAAQYEKLFPLLINNWRQDWKNNDLPFYWVQLSSFGPTQNSNQGSTWAELRESQDKTLKLAKTGMAVTIDIGNPTDIHPANKQDVAHRLAANALKFDYNKNVVHASPLYDKSEFSDNQAIIHFKSKGGDLVVKDQYGYIKGFEIAGEDRVFHYAQAQLQNNTIIVSHPKVKKPIAVRYAWADSPIDANLFNEKGFPVSPFRTDNWPGLTINNRFE